MSDDLKTVLLQEKVAELEQQLAATEEKRADLEFVWNGCEQELENCKSEREQLRRQLDAKQAEVDALMLEYCPSEMSQEQLDTWAAHQRPSEWKTNDELRQQLAERETQVTLLRGLLLRYRTETPPAHSPHMICHEVDAALAAMEPKL